MYSYMHAYGKKKTYVRMGFQNAVRSCKVGQNINISYTHVHVYTRTDADTECISARHPPSSHGQVFGGTVPHNFPAAAPAARCHARHRGHMCAISQVNPSFSRVERRKRRENQTVENCLRHNIITLAYMVLLTILNMGAPREQQQVYKETHFHAQRLCNCAAA